jgi:hypothetical protein
MELEILTELELARRQQQTGNNQVFGIHEINPITQEHVLKLANTNPKKNLIRKTVKTIVHESIHGILADFKLNSIDDLVYYLGYSSNPNFKNCFINVYPIAEKFGLI